MLEATSNIVPATNRTPVVVGAWLALGLAIALSGAVREVPQLAPAFILASTLGWVLAYARGGAARAWADALPMRALIVGHALRLPIGAMILWESAGGGVSPVFADRAGWGDMAVGVAAIAVALVAWQRPRVVQAFAWFGLIDIVIAFATAMYLLFVVRDASMLDAIARLPFPLLPFAAVPLVVTTHLLMLVRTSASRRAHYPAGRSG